MVPVFVHYLADHSGRMDSKFIHSTIDAPPGVPGHSVKKSGLGLGLVRVRIR